MVSSTGFFSSSLMLVQSHKLVLSHSNALVRSFSYGKDESNPLSHNSHIQKQNEEMNHTERKVNNQYLIKFFTILCLFNV
jgi:hypothetical protein